MNTGESFENAIHKDQMQMAERELSAFIAAVTDLFGPEQATRSTEDWLEELESMASSSRSTRRDWREVTVAASARLANRITVAKDRRTLAVATDTTAPIPPSNCFASELPV